MGYEIKGNEVLQYVNTQEYINPKTNAYTIENHVLEHVNENPYLGLLISENLKWSSHINKITNRATSTLGFLCRNLKHCSRTLKETPTQLLSNQY